jgi:hypothetical protein
MALEAEGKGRGKPIKLALSAIYGKTAQRVGHATWSNVIHAGLITAGVRSRINDAIAANRQRDVVMIATDAIYTIRRPLDGLDLGEGLGQWERTDHERLFVVKPGLWWPPRPRSAEFKFKSRGLSQSLIVKHIGGLERAFRRYIEAEAAGRFHAFPRVKIISELFVGLRLALRLGDLDSAARWIDRPIHISFEWLDKRGRMRVSIDHKHLILEPLDGTIAAQSRVYLAGYARPRWTDELEAERMHFEDHPDAVEVTPPSVED